MRDRFKLALLLTAGLMFLTFVVGLGFSLTEGFGNSEAIHPIQWALSLIMHDAALEHGLLIYGYAPYSLLAIKFPLFTMLAHPFAAIGISSPLSLVIISKVTLLAALISLNLLVEEHHPVDRLSNRTLLYLIANPFLTMFVFIMPYPEALFIACWAMAFLFYYREQWWVSGVCVGIAALVRPQAIILIGVMGLACIVQSAREKNLKDMILRFIDMSPLWVLGLPVYLRVIVEISRATEIPFAPLAIQNFFGRAVGRFPTTTIFKHIRHIVEGNLDAGNFIELYQVLLVIVLLFAPFMMGKLRGKIGWELQVFTWGGILMPLTTSIEAVGRYALSGYLIVVFTMLIPKRYDKVLLPILIVGGLTLMIFLNREVRWGYIP